MKNNNNPSFASIKYGTHPCFMQNLKSLNDVVAFLSCTISFLVQLSIKKAKPNIGMMKSPHFLKTIPSTYATWALLIFGTQFKPFILIFIAS